MDGATAVAIGCALWACERGAVPPAPSPARAPANKAVGPAVAASPAAPEAPAIPRARELFGHADWIGREITVDIVEPMLDARHSSAVYSGEYDVWVRDVGGRRLVLDPGKLEALPDPLQPPVRVRGTLQAALHGLRIRVAELTPQPFPVPERVGSAADLMKDRARWAGRYVQLEDTWAVGFELSQLGDFDGRVWLDSYDGAKVVCAPERREKTSMTDVETYQVRVTGFAYTAGRYGHMGMAHGLIVATEVVFLDPSRPECK